MGEEKERGVGLVEREGERRERKGTEERWSGWKRRREEVEKGCTDVRESRMRDGRDGMNGTGRSESASSRPSLLVSRSTIQPSFLQHEIRDLIR